MALRVSLVRVKREVFPRVYIWFSWWGELVQDGDKLGGRCPRGKGELFFNNLFGIGFRRAVLIKAHTTCFLMGGDMVILNVSW